MSSIYNYYDYRLFLKDYYSEKKEKLSFFSYRYISQKVGMDSSYIIKVLQGNLHISAKKIEPFCLLCEFSKKESAYFENLVYFCKSKNEKERKLFFEKLLELQNSSQKELEHKQYKFFQKWYYSATWSLLNFYSFDGNYEKLAQMHAPAITKKEAKESVQLLLDINLLKKDQNKYIVTDQNITTGTAWNSLAITQYQQEMIKKAEEALERFPKNERNISTITMNLPEKMLSIVEELTSNYRKNLIQLANNCENEKKSDRAYQLNIQLFPLSKGNS